VSLLGFGGNRDSEKTRTMLDVFARLIMEYEYFGQILCPGRISTAIEGG
jgi:hypothetical protein